MNGINVISAFLKLIRIQILLSEFYSLFWGILTLLLNIHKDFKGIDYIHKLKMCIFTMSAVLSNNILSIIILSCKGFNFQTGVLLRNTYELAFGLLSVIIDEDKCNSYFDTGSRKNDYDVWNKHFRFSELNKTLISFENTFNKSGNDPEADFLIKWRKKSYKFYSEFTHNSFTRCYLDSHVPQKNDNDEDIIILNLWGTNIARIENVLAPLNDLMFYQVLNYKNISKENLVGEYNHDLWNDAFLIHYISTYLNYKIHKEI